MCAWPSLVPDIGLPPLDTDRRLKVILHSRPVRKILHTGPASIDRLLPAKSDHLIFDLPRLMSAGS